MSKIVSLHPLAEKHFEIVPLHPLSDRETANRDRPLVEVDYKDKKITLKYIFPGFRLSAAKHNSWGSFTEVKMSGTGFLSVNQEPLLPCLRRFLQIPFGYDVVDCVSARSYLKYFEKILVTWAEEVATDEDEVDFDEGKYQVGGFNPRIDDIVDIEGYLTCKKHTEKMNSRKNNPAYFYMNGYKTILVQVKPLQYNPKLQLLRGYGEIIVTITIAPQKMDRKKWTTENALADPADNLDGFGNFLVNPDRKFYKYVDIAVSKAHRRGPEFIIIYSDYLKEPAEKLKDWKQKCGLKTEIVPLKESVENRVEEIKDCIRSKRRKPGSRLRYVLLFGDVNNIPLSQKGQGIKTDHYFYTPSDPVDTECILPWVSGGRIPVRKTEDGMSIVDKIIRYEKESPLPDSEYYKRITLAACFLDTRGREFDPDATDDCNFIKTMENISRHMVHRELIVNRIYVPKFGSPSKYRDGTPIPREVVERTILNQRTAYSKLLIPYIDEGQLIVGYRGHGQKDGWENPPLKKDDLSALTGNRPSIFFSINCYSGGFCDNTEAFAERLLKIDGGAASVIAATEWAWRWRNDSLIKGLFDAIWPGLIPVFPGTNESYAVKQSRLGDILDYAKTYILVKHGYNSQSKEHLEVYHVIGDPTLKIGGIGLAQQ